MFTVAMFIIAKVWRQPKYPLTKEYINKLWCPLAEEEINKTWYTYTMEYYSA